MVGMLVSYKLEFISITIHLPREGFSLVTVNANYMYFFKFFNDYLSPFILGFLENFKGII